MGPFQGWLIEKFGPRLLLSAGALCTGLSWVLAAHVTTVTGLYLTYGLLGGVGTGMIYVGVVGHMVQWFPDRRGFATGMVAAGYGFGAVLTTFPISEAIKASGYQHALLVLGHHPRRRRLCRGTRPETPGSGLAGGNAAPGESRPSGRERKHAQLQLR